MAQSVIYGMRALYDVICFVLFRLIMVGDLTVRFRNVDLNES